MSDKVDKSEISSEVAVVIDNPGGVVSRQDAFLNIGGIMKQEIGTDTASFASSQKGVDRTRTLSLH